MNPKPRFCFSLFLLMLFIVSGCASQDLGGITTDMPTNTELSTSLTNTPNVTKPQSTSASTQTFTPLPTLSPEDAIERVSEMIRTNGGCELPCWWGIIPGEARWSDTKRFFEPFALKIDENYGRFGQHSVIYPHPVFRSTFTTFYDEDGIIYLMNVNAYLSIYDSLHRFGTPEEVWLHSTGNIQGHAELDLELYYPSEGILIDFRTRTNPGYTGANVFRFCSKDFNDPSGYGLSRFFLWSPENNLTFGYFTRYFPRLEPPSRYTRISEVSILDEESFYNLFSTNTDACFETANDIWTKKLLPTITATP